MDYYCTYFDSRYLARGLALHASLKAHAGEFVLIVLCLDETAYQAVAAMNDRSLRPVRLSILEQFDAQLASVKSTRSVIEYYFTCTAAWILFVMETNPDAMLVTYLDADFFLFSSPQPIFQELGLNSILIVPHDFPEPLRSLESKGIYNVGLMIFRADKAGTECLRWWRARCLEWCFDREENGRFADQKYLDDWPTRFAGVCVAANKGIRLAPWNAGKYRLTSGASGALVDSDLLIVYHFHGLRSFHNILFGSGLGAYGVRPSAVLKDRVYVPYITALKNVGTDSMRLCGSLRGRKSSRWFREVARILIDGVAFLVWRRVALVLRTRLVGALYRVCTG